MDVVGSSNNRDYSLSQTEKEMTKKIIQAVLCLIVGAIAIILMNGILSSQDMSTYPATTRAVSSLLPLTAVMMVIVSIFRSLGKDTSEEIAMQIDWVKYGERMKLAYTAKFGGENKGFNDEVDARIKILVNTDRGFSRQLAKDWVHRMSNFVEIEWLRMENSNQEA